MLTKAVRSHVSRDSSNSSEDEERKPHAAITHVGMDCKGALSKAYNEKQPWTYKIEMIKEQY